MAGANVFLDENEDFPAEMDLDWVVIAPMASACRHVQRGPFFSSMFSTFNRPPLCQSDSSLSIFLLLLSTLLRNPISDTSPTTPVTNKRRKKKKKKKKKKKEEEIDKRKQQRQTLAVQRRDQVGQNVNLQSASRPFL